MRANTRWTHVPYRGGGPAVTDTLAGTVDALWVTPAPAMPHMRSGVLRPLAVSSLTRATGLADVSTVAEQGFAGFEVTRLWRTRAAKLAAEEGISSEAALERFTHDIPLGRFGTAEEIADVAAFLASPRSAYVVGQSVAADGGIGRGLL